MLSMWWLWTRGMCTGSRSHTVRPLHLQIIASQMATWRLVSSISGGQLQTGAVVPRLAVCAHEQHLALFCELVHPWQ